MPMYFYTYYSYEPFGRGYIGSRGSSVEPHLDRYFGSFTDNTFNPTEKIIISTHLSREEASQAEIKLHEFFGVDKNPHFSNKVKASTSGLCSYGMVRVNNGVKEKLVYRDNIPDGWKIGRLIDMQTYINTPNKYLNDVRRGDMFFKFKQDVESDPLVLNIPIRQLGTLYKTSHTSIQRWKKCVGRSFAICK